MRYSHLALLLFFVPVLVFAQTVENFIYAGMGIAVLLAVLMIAAGGIMYMASDAFTSKETAKEQILAAITGLLIILGGWVILNTINPQILQSTNLQNVFAPLRNAPTIQVDTPPPVTIGGAAGDIPEGSQLVIVPNSVPCETPNSTVVGGGTNYSCVCKGPQGYRKQGNTCVLDRANSPQCQPNSNYVCQYGPCGANTTLIEGTSYCRCNTPYRRLRTNGPCESPSVICPNC